MLMIELVGVTLLIGVTLLTAVVEVLMPASETKTNHPCFKYVTLCNITIAAIN
jgi:hypothetical protein